MQQSIHLVAVLQFVKLNFQPGLGLILYLGCHRVNDSFRISTLRKMNLGQILITKFQYAKGTSAYLS